MELVVGYELVCEVVGLLIVEFADDELEETVAEVVVVDGCVWFADEELEEMIDDVVVVYGVDDVPLLEVTIELDVALEVFDDVYPVG